jgi:hypothetical protein
MTDFDRRVGPPASREARQTRDDQASQDKSDQTRHEAIPVPTADKIKAGQQSAHANQQASEKPKSRVSDGKTDSHRPPEPAEEHPSERCAGHARQ